MTESKQNKNTYGMIPFIQNCRKCKLHKTDQWFPVDGGKGMGTEGWMTKGHKETFQGNR